MFQKLEQLIGIGLDRSKMNEIVGLFGWNEEKVFELDKLTVVSTRDTMTDKKYRHICYLCESVYALSVRGDMNISTNPGFEWQLRFYGKLNEN